jgi:alpha-N-arabinofuranosidase
MKSNTLPVLHLPTPAAGLRKVWVWIIAACLAITWQSPAQSNAPIPVIHIDSSHVTSQVSPTLYGLMTEEINFAYDGGLYAELIRNRTFKDDPTNAVHWQVIHEGDAEGAIALDTSEKVNDELSVSLRLDVNKVSGGQHVGIANEGYWGIPVKPGTRYHFSFWAKAGGGFNGPVTVSLVNNSNTTVFASAKVRQLDGKWKKYEGTFVTGKVPTSKDNLVVFSVSSPGTIWFSQPSLFPPTYHNRPNGNRPDLMQLLADMKPTFLRFPGGNYLEGNVVSNHFDWKNTVGGIQERPGHLDDGWGYWSSDGMGLLEFLEWCEDLHMQPVLAVYAGYSMRQGAVSGPELDGFVKDALDEIEYVTGDASTTWGSQRVHDGHKEPFKLEYVEIGNEDNLGTAGRTYDARFTKYYDAIKAKYPKLKIISTAPSITKIVTNRVPDLMDDHYYRNSMQMQSMAHLYDQRDRSAPKIFVGEWATREGSPTPNMNAALGDAAWMTCMERNSDVVIMSSYAPLFVNVSDVTPGRRGSGSMQWQTDLIGYDALSSYGSPAYYAQKMFSTYHGDTVLAATADNIPTREWQPPAARGRAGQPAPPPPQPQQVATLFFDATRDAKNHAIYVKIVNTSDKPQTVQVDIVAGRQIKDSGQIIEMTSANPTDVNSIEEPKKIVPVTRKANGLGDSFKRTYPAYSITVVQLETTL